MSPVEVSFLLLTHIATGIKVQSTGTGIKVHNVFNINIGTGIEVPTGETGT